MLRWSSGYDGRLSIARQEFDSPTEYEAVTTTPKEGNRTKKVNGSIVQRLGYSTVYAGVRVRFPLEPLRRGYPKDSG